MTGEARPLNPALARWLENRGLDLELAVACGIYTAKPVSSGGEGFQEPVPSDAGRILVWPYVDGGREVNAKFRTRNLDGQRIFYQRPGARKTFWNADILDAPELKDGRAALVITEGEPDAMVALQIGHPWSVSVPDGAPADRDQAGNPIPMKPDAEIDPANDAKFQYVFNNWDRLKLIKRFVLATDGDGPGMRLRDELARRLGRERCCFVEYPTAEIVPDLDGTGDPVQRAPKDLNEVLVHFGTEAARDLLLRAKPYPIKGLYQLSEYPDIRVETYRTGWNIVDTHLQVFPGAFMVVTGVPSHGKSSFVMHLCVNLAEEHGWPTALYSPEMPVVPYVRDVLRDIRRNSERASEDQTPLDAWIERHFVFIGDDPTGIDDEPITVDWLIETAGSAVIRHGIKVLVIDPWNEIDHARDRNETGSDYISRCIRLLKRFAKQFDVMVVVVAHPTKEVGKDGKPRAPTLYDVDGSAAWYNKADIGVVIHRPNEDVNETLVRIAKIRFRDSGEKGTVRMAFDRWSSRFETPLHPAPTQDPAL